VRLSKRLAEEQREYVLSRQILKSGASIGAYIEEADGAISRKEFSSKISIAYKEVKETHYWLRLLHESDYLSAQEFESLITDCDELCKLLFSILKTSRLKETQK
jgi:four helix bundle protein